MSAAEDTISSAKRQRTGKVIMGIDIEVHDWVDPPPDQKFQPWLETPDLQTHRQLSAHHPARVVRLRG